MRPIIIHQDRGTGLRTHIKVRTLVLGAVVVDQRVVGQAGGVPSVWAIDRGRPLDAAWCVRWVGRGGWCAAVRTRAADAADGLRRLAAACVGGCACRASVQQLLGTHAPDLRSRAIICRSGGGVGEIGQQGESSYKDNGVKTKQLTALWWLSLPPSSCMHARCCRLLSGVSAPRPVRQVSTA
jgi:hypothetical protein